MITHMLATAAVLAATASAPTPPTDKWVLNYDDAQCVAMRNYGTDKRPLFLIFKPSPSGSVMRLIVMEDGRAGDTIPVDGTIQFGTSPERKTTFLRYYDDQTKTRSVAVNLPMSEFKANMGAKTLSVRAAFIQRTLAVSDLGPLSVALEDCLADLKVAWNLSPENEGKLVQRARPAQPLFTLIGPKDYPSDAWLKSQGGVARFTMLIDEMGSIKDCSIEESSGIESLDSMSCFVFSTRAKFSPALGADGKPVPSPYFARIVWKMPDDSSAKRKGK